MKDFLSSYFSFLFQEMPALSAISVSKAGLGSAPVIKCHADTPALLAFEMLDNKVTLQTSFFLLSYLLFAKRDGLVWL